MSKETLNSDQFKGKTIKKIDELSLEAKDLIQNLNQLDIKGYEKAMYSMADRKSTSSILNPLNSSEQVIDNMQDSIQKILGVKKDASEEDITKAYDSKMKIFEQGAPKGDDTSKLQEYDKAYLRLGVITNTLLEMRGFKERTPQPKEEKKNLSIISKLSKALSLRNIFSSSKRAESRNSNTSSSYFTVRSSSINSSRRSNSQSR